MIDNHSDKINVFIPPRLQYQNLKFKNHQGWIDFQKQQNKSRCASTVKNVSVFLLIAQLI